MSTVMIDLLWPRNSPRRVYFYKVSGQVWGPVRAQGLLPCSQLSSGSQPTFLALVASTKAGFRAPPSHAQLSPPVPFLCCPWALSVFRWASVLLWIPEEVTAGLHGRATKGDKSSCELDVSENPLPLKIQVTLTSVLWQSQVLPTILTHFGEVFIPEPLLSPGCFLLSAVLKQTQ